MKNEIIKTLKQVFKLEKIKLKDIDNLIEIPANPEMGDYAFPCFILSKELKKNPNEIAKELKSKIKLSGGIEKVEVVGGYLNFFIDKNKFSVDLVKEILKKKQDFGKLNSQKKINTMVEFSQPNTHKAFHVGHIRNTSLGESIARISEFNNEKVVRANYNGDTGMHIAKWLWCYMKYHKGEKLVNDETWMASIYVDSVKRLAKNERMQNEVEEINRRLELGIDPELNKLWKKTRKYSIKSWNKIYNELNTHFDKYYFESEAEKRGKEISKELVEKDIAEISDNATIVNLEKYNLGVWVLLRRDGTVLYSAKDLSLAEDKFNDYKLDKSIYVIANEQDMHMKQVLKTLELMKFKDVEKIHHVSYGMVRLPHGKMSSRTGDNILYSDFIKEVTTYAKQRISQRTKKLGLRELQKRGLVLAISAIKYSMLKQTPNKNIIFKKEDALNFEGDTGPYILYSYARASSILRKAEIKNKKTEIKKLEPIEIKLVKKLSIFSEIVTKAYKNYNPGVIANYSYELSQIFNEFYHACPVIGADNEKFRLDLVKAFRIILKNSLDLLGIETLEEM